MCSDILKLRFHRFLTPFLTKYFFRCQNKHIKNEKKKMLTNQYWIVLHIVLNSYQSLHPDLLSPSESVLVRLCTHVRHRKIGSNIITSSFLGVVMVPIKIIYILLKLLLFDNLNFKYIPNV